MGKQVRLWIALALCVAGLLGMPAIQLATDLVDWRLFEGTYYYIFSDGFESGDTDLWSLVVGDLTMTLAFPKGSVIAEGILESFTADGGCSVPLALLEADAEGEIAVSGCRALSTPTAIGIRFDRPGI